MLQFQRTDSSNNDFQVLVDLLNEGLVITDGEEFDFFAQYNKIDALRHVIVAFQDGIAAGCGAIKEYSSTTTEIKRMFVKETFRGQRIAAQILKLLEEWSEELGYSHCILETGSALTSAIKLYQREGYQRIDNYGQYIGVTTSVCMTKKINQR